MRLGNLQRYLETIYGVRIAHRVEDFVITDPVLAHALDTSAGAIDTPEKLLVRQEGDDLNITLYLDAEILDHLARENPLEHLHDDNLADFWIALEGVSHFVYLIWNALLRKGVTLLELEMQAEVDKYIAAMVLLRRQARSVVPLRLRSFLFGHARFAQELDTAARMRYVDANYYAGKYCSQLEGRYLGRRYDDAIVSELRHFYRLPQGEKIRRIQSGIAAQ